MKKYHFIFLFVITTTLFIVGCGSKGENTGTPSSTDTVEAQSQVDETIPTTDASKGTPASQVDLSQAASPNSHESNPGEGGGSKGSSSGGAGSSSETQPPKEKQK